MTPFASLLALKLPPTLPAPTDALSTARHGITTVLQSAGPLVGRRRGLLFFSELCVFIIHIKSTSPSSCCSPSPPTAPLFISWPFVRFRWGSDYRLYSKRNSSSFDTPSGSERGSEKDFSRVLLLPSCTLALLSAGSSSSICCMSCYSLLLLLPPLRWWFSSIHEITSHPSLLLLTGWWRRIQSI